MPRKKSAAETEKKFTPKGKYAPAVGVEVDWGGFLNITLDEATKVDYAQWIASGEVDIWGLLTDAVSDGLKYGLSYDEENQCFVATLTGNGAVGFNTRFCLTARSGRFDDATALVMFKHCVMAQGDWSSYRPRVRGFDSWG